RAVIQNGSCATVNSNEFEVAVTNSGIWTGATSSSWNVATNWCGGVPTATTDVVIPSGTPNGPSIDITTAVARNITVDAGATLNFTGTTNIIDIKGNLVVNGTFNTVNGTVSLSGAVAQSFAGITYDNLVINSNTVKTLTGDANVANSLTLTLGIVNLNGFVLRTFSLTNITGGGSSSYFVTGTGGLKQFVGATPKLFHLGSSTSYNPVTINNTGTTGNFTVTMLDDIYNSYTGLVGSSPIATNVLRRTLNIEKDFVGAVSADITVQWNAVDESSLNRTQLIVGWFNGGVWSNTGAAVTAATGSNPYLHTFSITQTGLYGIGDVNSPLPVSLVSFGAKLVKGISLVSWTTASEINLKNFDVERSFDGHNFSKIGEVNAKGNSSSRLDYRFVDETSPEALAATNVLYYRLKQQDISGHFEYSKIVSVSHFNAIVFDVIATTPNPFNDEAEISYKTSSNSIVQVQVTDAFGKLIKTATLSPEIGANVYKLELDDLNASGVYFVKITQDGKSKIVKAIKK
ncbi:MAG: T9SS type A sorting domain-containing protein, partial [Bacteroidia bacterium]|nr:T9SS type A sorting domain-containing protein [Bacteroidia bacterium]